MYQKIVDITIIPFIWIMNIVFLLWRDKYKWNNLWCKFTWIWNEWFHLYLCNLKKKILETTLKLFINCSLLLCITCRVITGRRWYAFAISFNLYGVDYNITEFTHLINIVSISTCFFIISRLSANLIASDSIGVALE